MRNHRNQAGFTLVELLIAILCAAMIAAAATTALLVGLRINRGATDTVSRQTEVRIVQTLLESMVEEGKIAAVVEGENWALYQDHFFADQILSYRDGAIKASGSVLMDNIDASSAELSDSGLLTFEIHYEESDYRFSVYCRTEIRKAQSASYDSLGSGISASEASGRMALISVLESQLGSTGQIVGSDQYYSQWYEASWDATTPWCACFLSWSVDQVKSFLEVTPCFANVAKGVEGFTSNLLGSWADKAEYTPLPSDYIFFEWGDDDGVADHIGAVFYINGDTVYTIEGNSNGKVEIRSYPLDDSSILGYGILRWNQSVQANETS